MPRRKKTIDHHQARQQPEFLVVGRVIRPHGLRGFLIVEEESDLITSVEPGETMYLGPGDAPVRVTAFRRHRQRFLLRIEGCASREDAEQYRGMELKFRFEEMEGLPADTYYYWQILGLEVYTESGELLGRIENIIETGANDVYLVRGTDGNEILLPAIESVVRNVDLGSGKMFVHILPGLLPDRLE